MLRFTLGLSYVWEVCLASLATYNLASSFESPHMPRFTCAIASGAGALADILLASLLSALWK